MKRFIKKTLLGLFGGALIVGSLGACSHRGPGGWQSGTEASPESRARMVDKIGSRLDLDAAQKQKLAVLADRLQTQRAALRGASDPRADMRALFGQAYERYASVTPRFIPRLSRPDAAPN